MPVTRQIFLCSDQNESKGYQEKRGDDHQEHNFQFRILLIDKLDADTAQCVVCRVKEYRRPDTPGLKC
jgi:hypothetical protein